MKTWRTRLILVAAALMLAVFVAACSGGDAPNRDLIGLLPVPTRTPVPTLTDSEKHDRYDLCPRLPREACLLPGDVVNVYEALSLDQLEELRVNRSFQSEWVLGDDVQKILRKLDVEVVLEPWALRQLNYLIIELSTNRTYSLRLPALLIDLDAGAMGVRAVEGQEVQWPMPQGFAEDIMASYSDSTPTPLPTGTPTPQPTQLTLANDAPFFENPVGPLVWDGPDDRLSSSRVTFCEAPQALTDQFGIPNLIYAEDGRRAFLASRAIPRPPDLRRTGYFHDGWEIWQADDHDTIYVTHADLAEIVLEYVRGCF